MGDSAGGNLLLALLSHISHPHPSTNLPIPRISLSTPFRGAVLNSPWISFDMFSDSFKHNEFKDCITIEVGKKWSGAWLACPWPHKEASDYYNQAITAPLRWWEGLMVREVLVLGGGEEVLVDGIKDFAQRLGKPALFPPFIYHFFSLYHSELLEI
jgi:acetyl esterase/lipase